MKTRFLLPVLALTLGACDESPTSALLTSDTPQFALQSANGEIRFANDGEGTNCAQTTAATVTCDFAIENPNGLDLYVTTHVEFAWHYECIHKNAKKTVRGTVIEYTNERIESSTESTIVGPLVHTATGPANPNPCAGLKGRYTLAWSLPQKADWFVYADENGNHENVWIQKSSTGT